MIVGPAVGGLLSRPALQYPSVFPQSSIWGLFPYLLPCLGEMIGRIWSDKHFIILFSFFFSIVFLSDLFLLLLVCSLIAVIGFILLYMWLPETSGGHISSTTNSTDKSATKKIRGGNVPYPAVKFSVLTSVDPTETLSIQGGNKEEKRTGEDIMNVRIEGSKRQCKGTKKGEKQPNMDDEDCTTDVELGSNSRDESSDDMFSLFTTNTNISSPIRTYSKFSKYSHLKSFDCDVDTTIGIVIEDSGSKMEITNQGEEGSSIVKVLTRKGSKRIKKSVKPQSLSEMIKNKQIRFLSILYTCFCFVIMFVDESFPLWAVTSVQQGGLSWSSGQVGSALACVGEWWLEGNERGEERR